MAYAYGRFDADQPENDMTLLRDFMVFSVTRLQVMNVFLDSRTCASAGTLALSPSPPIVLTHIYPFPLPHQSVCDSVCDSPAGPCGDAPVVSPEHQASLVGCLQTWWKIAQQSL